MRPNTPTRQSLTLMLTVLAAANGCDQRVVDVAREASDRQAAQNQQMAELQQEVARGTHELVQADAATRRATMVVHHDLARERRELSRGWTDLESERRQVDSERRSRSNWQATVLFALGAVALAALLGFLWRLVARAQETDSLEEEFSQLLVAHLLPGESRPPLPLGSGQPPDDRHQKITPQPPETPSPRQQLPSP